MPDTVTESFCERCGTRYTFRTASTLNPMRRTRGVAAGLGKYLTSRDSLSHSVADALQAEAESVANRQMTAYHKVFSFCIQCRQYACRTCWNDGLGRCLTCAPASAVADGPESWPGQDILAPLMADAGPDETAPAPAGYERATAAGAQAWPTGDVAELIGAAETFVREATPIQADVEQPSEPEPAVVADRDGAAEWPVAIPEPDTAAEHIVALEMAASEPMAPLPSVVTWEEDAISVEEPVVAVALPLPEAATITEGEPHAEGRSASGAEDAEEEAEAAVAEAGPQPIAAGATDESIVTDEEPAFPELPAERIEALVDAPVDVPVEPTFPELPPDRMAAYLEAPVEVPIEPPFPELPSDRIAALADAPVEPAFPEIPADRIAAIVETPAAAARRVQLETLGLEDPGRAVVATSRPAVVPQPRTAASEFGRSAPIWEASARQLADAQTASAQVQLCEHCSLVLSASARFCRRCGMRQARSA